MVLETLNTKHPRVKSLAIYLLQILALAVVYHLAVRVGLRMAYVQVNTSPVWPPTGTALAALLIFGYRLWPGISLGVLLLALALGRLALQGPPEVRAANGPLSVANGNGDGSDPTPGGRQHRASGHVCASRAVPGGTSGLPAHAVDGCACYVVSPGGEDTGSCSSSSPCRTVQYALTQADPGGRVCIADRSGSGFEGPLDLYRHPGLRREQPRRRLSARHPGHGGHQR